MTWYDLEEKQESKKEYIARIRYDKLICEKTKKFTDIIGNDIPHNVQYRFVTNQSFNAIIVIDYLLKKYDITDIYMAVYRMNLLSVNKLKSIIDGNKIKCSILLSSFFRENKRYEKWCHELISFSRGNENVRIAFAVTHAKVFLAKTKDNRHIVFEGSGNLSDNARIEQYLLEDNQVSYDFHKQWINEILNKE